MQNSSSTTRHKPALTKGPNFVSYIKGILELYILMHADPRGHTT